MAGQPTRRLVKLVTAATSLRLLPAVAMFVIHNKNEQNNKQQQHVRRNEIFTLIVYVISLNIYTCIYSEVASKNGKKFASICFGCLATRNFGL